MSSFILSAILNRLGFKKVHFKILIEKLLKGKSSFNIKITETICPS